MVENEPNSLLTLFILNRYRFLKEELPVLKQELKLKSQDSVKRAQVLQGVVNKLDKDLSDSQKSLKELLKKVTQG